MCGVEYLSKKSPTCMLAQTPDHHVWQMYTYTLCPTGVARKGPCDNVYLADDQTENDFVSLRMTPCSICEKFDGAERACVEAKRLTDKEYGRAWTAAYAHKEETHVSSR